MRTVILLMGVLLLSGCIKVQEETRTLVDGVDEYDVPYGAEMCKIIYDGDVGCRWYRAKDGKYHESCEYIPTQEIVCYNKTRMNYTFTKEIFATASTIFNEKEFVVRGENYSYHFGQNGITYIGEHNWTLNQNGFINKEVSK